MKLKIAVAMYEKKNIKIKNQCDKKTENKYMIFVRKKVVLYDHFKRKPLLEHVKWIA